MAKSKIGTIEAIMLILTIVVAHSVLSMPTNILSSYKSASILNVIYVGIIAIGIAYIIYKLLKNFPSMDIVDISEAIEKYLAFRENTPHEFMSCLDWWFLCYIYDNISHDLYDVYRESLDKLMGEM